MYNSCMDYDEYDASTSSASSSLVATINTYCSWGRKLGSIWYVPSESCQAATQMQTWPFSAFFLISSSGTVPINVHVHLYRQLSAGLPDYYGSRQPAVTVRPFPAIGYICRVRAYRKEGTYIHHKYSEPSKRHEATWSLEICRDL